MSGMEIQMYLETREDYENLRKNFPFEVWSKDFEALLSVSIEELCVGACEATETKDKDENGNKLTKVKKAFLFPRFDKWQRDKARELTESLEDKPYETCTVDHLSQRLIGETNFLRRYKIKDEIIYYIFGSQEVENSKISKLGYTVEEVYELLLGIGEAEDELKKTTEIFDKMEENVKKDIMESTGMTEEEYQKMMKEEEEEVKEHHDGESIDKC